MRPLLDILVDEKMLMDEISKIEQSIDRLDDTADKSGLEDRLLDLQLELAEVIEEMQNYLKNQ